MGQKRFKTCCGVCMFLFRRSKGNLYFENKLNSSNLFTYISFFFTTHYILRPIKLSEETFIMLCCEQQICHVIKHNPSWLTKEKILPTPLMSLDWFPYPPYWLSAHGIIKPVATNQPVWQMRRCYTCSSLGFLRHTNIRICTLERGIYWTLAAKFSNTNFRVHFLLHSLGCHILSPQL